MSSRASPVDDLDRPTKRRIQRRHGACEPCRTSKTKCDGRTPCGACRSERRRQCPCVYSEKAKKLQQVTAEIRRRAESERRNNDESLRQLSDDETSKQQHDGHFPCHTHNMSAEEIIELSTTRQDRDQACTELEADSARMSHAISVCAVVDEFKRLKPARGYSAQVVARCVGFGVSENVATDEQPHDMLQSLAKSSPYSPTLGPRSTRIQAIKARLDMVDLSVREGHLTRAWVDIASLVREAQLFHATVVDEQPSSATSGWLKIWNSILDLEAQIGLTVGRPTCVLFAKKTSFEVTDDAPSLEESVEEIRTDLYQHIQGMLALDLSGPTAIRDFLERARTVINHEPFNRVGLCTTEGHSLAVRDLHLNTHLFLMLIYCRMASLCSLFSHDLTNGSWSDTPAAEIIKSLNLHQPRKKLAYCHQMFRSANFILDSFISLHQDHGEQTGRSWMRCHSAYTAAVILGIAKLRHEVEWHATTERLKALAQIFLKLSKTNAHTQLFNTAVARLHDLSSVKEPASETTRKQHGQSGKRSAPDSVQTSPRDTLNRLPGINPVSDRVSPTNPLKRGIDMVDGQDRDTDLSQERFGYDNSREDDTFRQPPAAVSQSCDDSHLGHLCLFEDNSATYSQSNRSFTNVSGASSATSFCESDMSLQAVMDLPFGHPGPPFAYPFPYHVYHPPLTWNNSTYHVQNHDDTSIPIQITTIPHYASDGSAMTSDLMPQYSLQDANIRAKPLNTHSIQSSPMQTSPEGNLTSMKASSSVQADSRYSNPSQLSMVISRGDTEGQTFLQPSPGRKNAVNKRQPPLAMSQYDPQHSSVDWQSLSAIAPDHDAHSDPRGHLTVSSIGRRTSAGNDAHPGLQPRQRQQPDSCYSHSELPSAPDLLSNQAYPSTPITYLNPATGMLEQHHPHGQYHSSHLPTYTKYLVPNPGQFQQQWRRTSIDTGGSSNAPL